MLSTNYAFTHHMYKEDLALNNLQRLICHKTQPNQTYEEEDSHGAIVADLPNCDIIVSSNLHHIY